MPIKTFRGLLEDGDQVRIRLQHKDGKTGYRIKNFQIISERPGHTASENLVKVWSILQTTAPDEYVDFSEQTLLGVAYYANHASNKVATTTIIFDRVIFSQDIFINHKDIDSGEACNYYMELETIALDDAEATAVILKNFRNTNSYAT